MVVLLIMVFSCSLLLNLQQLLIWPISRFNKKLHRELENFVGWPFGTILTFSMEGLAGFSTIYSGDPRFWQTTAKHKSAIVIANHTSYADWPLMFSLAYRCGHVGRIRIFLKDVAKLIPGIGWAAYLHEFFFLRKSWNSDSRSLTTALQSFRSTGSDLWACLFPEGTFADAPSAPSIVGRSHDYCKQLGVPLLQHVLVPRYKGMMLAVSNLRGQVKEVIDMTIAFAGCAASDLPEYNTFLPLLDPSRVLPDVIDYAAGSGPRQVFVHLRTFAVEDVPSGEAELQRWLCERFREKDELLQHFNKHGRFPGESYEHPLNRAVMLLHVLVYLSCGFGLLSLLHQLPGPVYSALCAAVLAVSAAGAVVQYFVKGQ